MNQKKKRLIILCCAVILVFSASIANAAGVLQKISVNFSAVKKVTVNGKEQKITSTLKPFVYNGQVYFASGAFQSMFNKFVKYDSKTGIVTVNDSVDHNVRIKALEAEKNSLTALNLQNSKVISENRNEIARLKEEANGLNEIIRQLEDRQNQSPSSEQVINTNQGKKIKIPASSEKGFNYAYFLFIPTSIDKAKVNNLMVEGNNTGFHKEIATDILTEEQVNRCGGYDLSLRLNIPFLMPSFPRPADGRYVGIYTHDLGRTTFTNIPADDKLGRIDLQLIAMIKNAKQYLEKEGIKVEEKILMYGFSASSHFANRFALLHPEYVRALAVGGINSLPTLPVSSWNNTSLRFPIGIADVKQVTGVDFNMSEYKKVAQYIFMGDQDTNDTAPAGDCFEPNDTQTIYSVLGKNMVPDRLETCKKIFESASVPAQFVTYKNVGHWGMYGYIQDDVFEFFKANLSSKEGLIKIQPHYNPNR